MRQAGRYQASYREVRKKVSFFELCRTPELAAEVTVTAVDDLDADAGIIFSDILVPVQAMGVDVDIGDHGPRIGAPIRDRAAVDALRVGDPQTDLRYVMDAIRQTQRALAGKVPLIGFAGGPLTLASYLVEGGHSNTFLQLKRMLFADSKTSHVLLDKLARMVSLHLRAQVESGANAIQLFESWGGILSPRDYLEYCFPYQQRIFEELADLHVPRIIFGTGMSSVLEQMKRTGAEVIGLDWRIELDEARRRLGEATAVQGNLDPCCLFMSEVDLEQRIAEIVRQAGASGGHIFNLGHGILPPTDPARARFLVDTVHRLTSANRAS
jgi:uroporphyrinogen decarboxylase